MAPDRKWSSKEKVWRMPSLPANAKYIIRTFTEEEITIAAMAQATVLESQKPVATRFPAWYKFKSPPMDHQMDCLNKAWGINEIAMFMWMGRGKTFTAINLVAAKVMDAQLNLYGQMNLKFIAL